MVRASCSRTFSNASAGSWSLPLGLGIWASQASASAAAASSNDCKRAVSGWARGWGLQPRSTRAPQTRARKPARDRSSVERCPASVARAASASVREARPAALKNAWAAACRSASVEAGLRTAAIRCWVAGGSISSLALCLILPSFPNSRLGTHLRETPVSRPSPPSGHHVHQPRHPRVIPRTGIPPMRRLIDVAALHGVVVHVFQLLPHHPVVADLFGMAALLPDLVLAVGLVPKLGGAKLPEQYRGTVSFQQLND